MKKFRTFLTVFAIAVFSSASQAAEIKTATLEVKGMTCASCPLTVKLALKQLAGVRSADVDYKSATAQVSFDPDKVKPEQLAKAVSDIGFPASVRK